MVREGFTGKEHLSRELKAMRSEPHLEEEQAAQRCEGLQAGACLPAAERAGRPVGWRGGERRGPTGKGVERRGRRGRGHCLGRI